MNDLTALQTWSAAQLEQLRKFLQKASQIPSTNSMLEVLQSNQTQYQQSPPGHDQKITGTSFGYVPSTVSQTSNIHGQHPVSRPSLPLASSSVSSVPDGKSFRKYPPPDVNLMVYDPGTGYRFDRTTGLYYDANTRLFINEQLNVLLRWNEDISSYTLFGRSSDVTAPAPAQDPTRFLENRTSTTVLTQGVTPSASEPRVPSSCQVSAGNMLSFRRERSLSFEEMSPVRDSPSKQSPDPNKYGLLDQRERRRSLSFDEMTPERDAEDFSNFTKNKKNRSPSYERRRRSSRSPRSSPGRNRGFPDERYSPDVGDSSGRCSSRMSSPYRDSRERTSPWWDHSRSPGRRSPWRDHSRSPGRRSQLCDNSRSPGTRSPWRDHSRSPGRRSPWRDHSRSPGRRSPRRDNSRSPGRRRPWRDHSRSPRRSLLQAHARSPGRRSTWRNHSRSPRPDFTRSPRPHHPRSPSPRLPYPRPVPRRGSQLSPSPLRSLQRGFSPIRSPDRATKRRFSPNRGSRRRLSPERSDPGDRRASRRSQSPSSHFGRRHKNSRSERGHSSTYVGRRCSRSRSRSRGRTHREIDSTRRRRRSRSPLGGRTAPRGDPELVRPEDASNSIPGRNKKAPPRRSKGVSKLLGPPGLHTEFMAVGQLHKKNLLNPKNKYGRIFPPEPAKAAFIMLTPLPHRGDREWEDLDVLLRKMLEAEGLEFLSVDISSGGGGAPFDYCLIRLKAMEDAFRWYMAHEGTIELADADGSTSAAFMHIVPNHWKCGKCKTLNFALRHFCYTCFWYVNRPQKSPVQVSQLVTSYVGITGLDCRRFLTVKAVLADLPPLDSFKVDKIELLTELSGIPLGLCVFRFKEKQESLAFYKFLQEKYNPIFVDFVDRIGLSIDSIDGPCLKDIFSSGNVLSTSKVRDSREHSGDTTVAVGDDASSLAQKAVIKNADTLKFANPETDPNNNPLLWWRFVEGYDPQEGADILKHLFEEHPLVAESLESLPAVVLIGPLPIPVACDLMSFRSRLNILLTRSGFSTEFIAKLSICKSHHFGAPYNYSLLRFPNKIVLKEWCEKNEGKLTLTLESGTTWPVYLHHARENWQCGSCHKFNFPLRVQCFSCYHSRIPNHTAVTFPNKSTKSIAITGFQNWCATKELLFRKLPFLREVKNLTIEYLNEPTGVPLGICIIKSATVEGSDVLMAKLQDALIDEIARTNIQTPKQPLLVNIL